ncbi:hypothetical protein [Algoriphagus antarcticus]|uniref:Uncharacterized protein n=1 Tax=Algoriphagus antarcticus TaxID=238540 RepID=A0A3E0DK89_9BACT|nr:hypothetical protein [Algoriphagus antarcticus]REG83047.1 hypothetical protein C8N25_11911 [Algoriphagus antarcticus]
MKQISVILLLLICLIVGSCSTNSDSIILDLSTESLKITINDKGSFINFIDVNTGTDYISTDTLAPLMSVRINNEIIHPKSATVKDDIISLDFENEVVAEIKIEEKGTHFTFELQSITNNDTIELIVWGPYPTSIQKTISETVGVVRDDDFAIGIQALNIKTLGGYPWNESDRMPEFDFVREEDPNNMHPKSDGSVLYRIEAAAPLANGSSLQAYTRNRNTERIYSDVGHDKIVAPPYDDGGVIGSKIALFGSPESKALETIGAIEIAEGLPHPMIDGEWVKTNRNAAAAYLITNFTEATVDDAIALTKKAGLKYLYHYGKTFETWGQFELYKGEFPNGIEGLKAAVDKAAAEGVLMGTHFLSNFIATDDAYVTPIPDERLAKVGSSMIVGDIDANASTITIESPEFFNQMKNNNLKTVMIGEELIRYGSVSEESPWRLLDCQRGAFDTKANSHKSGDKISKLLDHGYKVFLSETDLTIEMSKTMADLYNQTGLRQISFDGLEGNRSTGLGTYGESLMPYTWYTNLSDELKDHLIIDASRTTHFFWHIYSRMNWGEPWYAGFRESQAEYRFNNQAYFQRNFMPGMLGWFKMTPETSIEDMEWMLAKSAGYDAGYALVADLPTVSQNGNSDKILELIGDWEKLRISNSFSEAQKEKMRNSDKEFTLKKINEAEWNLLEVYSEIFTHEKKVRQPGEPLHSTLEFNNPGNEQVVNFTLTAMNSDVSGITLEMNGYKKVALPGTIKEGQTLKYTGDKEVLLYDSNWQIIKRFEIDLSDLKINTGKNLIAIDSKFDRADKEANIKVEIRTFGETQDVVLKK